MWLGVDEPQNAIANARILLQARELSGAARAETHIFFIALLLRLESIEDAAAEREKLRASEPLPGDLRMELRVLDALLLRRNAEIDDAFELLFSSAAEATGCRALEILRDDIGDRHEGLSDWLDRARNRSHITESLPPSPRLITH